MPWCLFPTEVPHPANREVNKMESRQDNRQRPRAEIGWPVTIRTAHKIDAETKNISSDGAYINFKGLKPQKNSARNINATESLPPEGSFRMLIWVPDRYPLKLTAKVVWTDSLIDDQGESYLGVGTQFLDISEGDRKFLHRLVADSRNVLDAA